MTQATPTQLTITTRIRLFFLTIWMSLTDLDIYVKALTAPFHRSVRFILGFYLVLGLILTTLYSILDLPTLIGIVDQAQEQLSVQIPEQAQVEWDGTQLTHSQLQTLELPYPSISNLNDLKYLLRTDFGTDQDPQDISTMFFANATQLHVNQLQGDWMSVRYTDIFDQPFSWDRDGILTQIEQTSNALKSTLSLSPLLIFVLTSVGLLLVRAVTLIIDAFILSFLFQLIGKRLPYKKIYQLTLHVLVPSELINQVSARLFPQDDIPMFALSFWLISTLVIWHVRKFIIYRVVSDSTPEPKDKETKKRS